MKYIKKLFMFLFAVCLSVWCFGIMMVKAEDISVLSITKTYGDAPFSIGFTSSSDGGITYSSSNKKVASVSKSGKVTIKGCGSANIEIKSQAKDNYKEKTAVVTIKVKPQKQKILQLKDDNGNIKLSWQKDKKSDGYYIYYSTDYKFNNDFHKINVTKNSTTSKTINKLKSGKKYYVKVCSYKKDGKEIISGDFSKVYNIRM